MDIIWCEKNRPLWIVILHNSYLELRDSKYDSASREGLAGPDGPPLVGCVSYTVCRIQATIYVRKGRIVNPPFELPCKWKKTFLQVASLFYSSCTWKCATKSVLASTGQHSTTHGQCKTPFNCWFTQVGVPVNVPLQYIVAKPTLINKVKIMCLRLRSSHWDLSRTDLHALVWQGWVGRGISLILINQYN